MSLAQKQGALRRWKKWRQEHPEALQRKRQYLREADIRYAVKRFGSEAAKRYFLKYKEPLKNKQARIDAQGGKCANRACGKPIDLTVGNQDHNHVTGEMRGVLCPACNTALGLLQDSAVVISGLQEYREVFS